MKRYGYEKIKGFDPKRMCVATLLFEGMKDEVELQQKKLYNIAKIYIMCKCFMSSKCQVILIKFKI